MKALIIISFVIVLGVILYNVTFQVCIIRSREMRLNVMFRFVRREEN